MTNQYHDVLVQAPLQLGHRSQFSKALEELAELQLILARYNHEPARYLSPEPIIDEIADAAIMLHQLATIFGKALVDQRIEFKVNRLKLRIET